MDQITGKEFQGITEGGAAAAGNYVWIKMVLSGKEQIVLIEQSMIPQMIDSLSKVAALAENERQRTTDPSWREKTN